MRTVYSTPALIKEILIQQDRLSNFNYIRIKIDYYIHYIYFLALLQHFTLSFVLPIHPSTYHYHPSLKRTQFSTKCEKFIVCCLNRRGDDDVNGLSPPGPNAAGLMLLTRWGMWASGSDNVGQRSRLAWIPPTLETRELWQPSLGIKINLQVK